MALVRLGHVFPDGGVPATLSAPIVHRDTLVVVEYLDHRWVRRTSTWRPISRCGTSKAVQHLDVIVGMHLGALPFGIFERLVGQGAQCGAFDLLIKIPAGLTNPAHDLCIEGSYQLGNGRIQA